MSERTRRLRAKVDHALEAESAHPSLDELVTDCVAEAMAIRARIVRFERQARTLAEGNPEPADQRLAILWRQAERDQDELEALMVELRTHRDAARQTAKR